MPGDLGGSYAEPPKPGTDSEEFNFCFGASVLNSNRTETQKENLTESSDGDMHANDLTIKLGVRSEHELKGFVGASLTQKNISSIDNIDLNTDSIDESFEKIVEEYGISNALQPKSNEIEQDNAFATNYGSLEFIPKGSQSDAFSNSIGSSIELSCSSNSSQTKAIQSDVSFGSLESSTSPIPGITFRAFS